MRARACLGFRLGANLTINLILKKNSKLLPIRNLKPRLNSFVSETDQQYGIIFTLKKNC